MQKRPWQSGQATSTRSKFLHLATSHPSVRRVGVRWLSKFEQIQHPQHNAKPCWELVQVWPSTKDNTTMGTHHSRSRIGGRALMRSVGAMVQAERCITSIWRTSKMG